MKRSIITFLTFLNLGICYSQNLTKNYVDNWIKSTFPKSNIDNETIYILNGILIQSDSLNTAFIKHQIKDLITIDYVDEITSDKLILCKPLSGAILLQTKGNQSRKLIREYFSETKIKYQKPSIITTADINPENGEPVLIINGKVIFHQNVYEELNNLKTKQIIGLNIIERPVSNEIYGANARNGLIILTIK